MIVSYRFFESEQSSVFATIQTFIILFIFIILFGCKIHILETSIFSSKHALH